MDTQHIPKTEEETYAGIMRASRVMDYDSIMIFATNCIGLGMLRDNYGRNSPDYKRVRSSVENSLFLSTARTCFEQISHYKKTFHDAPENNVEKSNKLEKLCRGILEGAERCLSPVPSMP